MKLSNAFDSMAKENRFLRTLSVGLVFLSALLLGLVFTLYDKAPVYLERNSRGLEILRVTEFARSPDDLNRAIAIMLAARFNTDSPAPDIFLNQRQMALRDGEQREMKSRSMTQAVVVRAINLAKEEATVDFDRVIAVGELRSALRAKIKVKFEETAPNELNPFGLLLSLADPIEKPEVQK